MAGTQSTCGIFLGGGALRNSEKMIQPLGKTTWQFLKSLDVHLPHDPAIPLLNIYPKK